MRSRARRSAVTGHRHGRQQRLRVGVEGPRRRPRRGRLDDPAEVHDRDAVGDLPHHRRGRGRRRRRSGRARSCRSASRLTTCAWTETSSAETGSSAIDQPRARARARGRCRCAGAARRRTRAGSGRRARGRSPTSSISSAPGRAISLARPAPWTRAARRSIAPTRLRGFSEAYGSWKTICISRRSRPQLAPASAVMSRAVELDRAGGELDRAAAAAARASTCRSPTRRPARASRPRAPRGRRRRPRATASRPRGARMPVPRTGKCFSTPVARSRTAARLRLAIAGLQTRRDGGGAQGRPVLDRQVAGVEVAAAATVGERRQRRRRPRSRYGQRARTTQPPARPSGDGGVPGIAGRRRGRGRSTRGIEPSRPHV